MVEYEKTSWTNGVTALNDDNLNHIETGIENNANAINSISEGMRFKGYVSRMADISNPSIGDVYQADAVIIVNASTSSRTKPGDLIVYTGTNTGWHVIPSGDDAYGTVTSITAGAGLTTNGGPIVSSGTLSIDANYINNMITTKMNADLAPIARSGSYADLIAVPSDVGHPFHSVIGEEPSADAVLSESAIVNALNGKSDSNHIHSISDITSLEDQLDNKALADHRHGRITVDGKMLNDLNQIVTTAGFLKTNNNGLIIHSSYVNSNEVYGTQFNVIRSQQGETPVYILTSDTSPQTGKTYYSLNNNTYTAINPAPINPKEAKAYEVEKIETIDLKTLVRDIRSIKYVLPQTPATETTPATLVNAAAADHTHEVFSNKNDGFAPTTKNLQLETGDSVANYVLCGDGTWKKRTSGVVTEERNEFIKFYTTTDGQPELGDNQMKIVVLDSPPDDNFVYQDNWLYLIKG